jgi:heme-binding NEAT domain protein
MSASSGSGASAQAAAAKTQRVRKRQPDGTAEAEGISPVTASSRMSLARPATGSQTAAMSEGFRMRVRAVAILWHELHALFSRAAYAMDEQRLFEHGCSNPADNPSACFMY